MYIFRYIRRTSFITVFLHSISTYPTLETCARWVITIPSFLYLQSARSYSYSYFSIFSLPTTPKGRSGGVEKLPSFFFIFLLPYFSFSLLLIFIRKKPQRESKETVITQDSIYFLLFTIFHSLTLHTHYSLETISLSIVDIFFFNTCIKQLRFLPPLS